MQDGSQRAPRPVKAAGLRRAPAAAQQLVVRSSREPYDPARSCGGAISTTLHISFGHGTTANHDVVGCGVPPASHEHYQGSPALPCSLLAFPKLGGSVAVASGVTPLANAPAQLFEPSGACAHAGCIAIMSVVDTATRIAAHLRNTCFSFLRESGLSLGEDTTPRRRGAKRRHEVRPH